jgi:DnaJ-class molecular chaperone
MSTRQAGHRIGDWLFADGDARARRRGWQVTTGSSGLGRRYRDPRFDLLIRCPECRGTGAGADDRPCRRCPGTGRLTLDRSFSPARR